MSYREIVRTCSNPKIAAAAVISIGGDFARNFSGEALRRRMSPGDLAASLVREFAAAADEIDFNRVAAAAEKTDLPILYGLRYILERAVEREAPARRYAAL